MDSLKKFCDLDVLAQVLSEHKKQGRKIVLCHGVFDLLHIGHIRYLRQSKQRGDILAVTITADQFVDKGPGRPVFTERLRAEFLASLDFVDYVAVNKWPTAENTLRFLQPHFYAKGAEFKNLDDQTGKIALEAQAAKEAGVELIFIEDIVFSSSSLINQNLSVYSEELTQYLNIVRQKYTLDDVLAGIDLMKNLKVLVVGDAIVDEYVYCSPLGLSSKDPTLVLHRLSSELFPGGAVAVARHLAGLAGQADIFTLLGALHLARF